MRRARIRANENISSIEQCQQLLQVGLANQVDQSGITQLADVFSVLDFQGRVAAGQDYLAAVFLLRVVCCRRIVFCAPIAKISRPLTAAGTYKQQRLSAKMVLRHELGLRGR